MANKLNSWLRSFFTLNKSEQKGIFILIFLIVLMGIINLLIPFIYPSDYDVDSNIHQKKITEFLNRQQKISDSIKTNKYQDFSIKDSISKITPIIFNPNNLPTSEWEKMGFSDRQIKNIKNYEASGGKFRKKEDLKKIYTITEADYKAFEEYIILPKTKKKNYKTTKSKQTVFNNYKTTELNNADSAQLVNYLGFTPRIAKRTIGYRNLLGGFYKNDQLKEVYGLSDDFYNTIKQFVTIDTSTILKIDINNISFKQLLKHPYFDFNLTSALFNTKNKVGSFNNINEIKLIEGITDSTFNKVSYYLYIRPE